MVRTSIYMLCLAIKRLVWVLLVIGPLLIFGCARPPTKPSESPALYLSPIPAAVAAGHAPAYLILDPSETFNKIGTPSGRMTTDGDPEIFVDPQKPTIYFESQDFQTAKGRYTNLIYRIHFQEVPLDWGRVNLTAGRNSGLLFIYTLDETRTLLLVTTVHTCGCFLAFLPTDAMPKSGLPADWSTGPQSVYGQTLPGILDLGKDQTKSRIVFTLASETHRVGDVTVAAEDSLKSTTDPVTMDLLPMQALHHLAIHDNTVSFFETDGTRAGYVRDNTKILERLFISWWAMDLHVGEDKAYGKDDKSRAIFYTSLKFWDRKVSDLKNFPTFLAYWGWRL
jgi:hypothetical protein